MYTLPNSKVRAGIQRICRISGMYRIISIILYIPDILSIL
jgi:hypothetical protein